MLPTNAPTFIRYYAHPFMQSGLYIGVVCSASVSKDCPTARFPSTPTLCYVAASSLFCSFTLLYGPASRRIRIVGAILDKILFFIGFESEIPKHRHTGPMLNESVIHRARFGILLLSTFIFLMSPEIISVYLVLFIITY